MWAVAEVSHDRITGLSIVLGIAAVAAGLGVARVRAQRLEISAAFLVYVLAGAFLGPTSAFVAAVISEVAARSPNASIDGVLVQELVSGGIEVLVGMKRDPVFGPVVLVSPGGIFVELFEGAETA